MSWTTCEDPLYQQGSLCKGCDIKCILSLGVSSPDPSVYSDPDWTKTVFVSNDITELYKNWNCKLQQTNCEWSVHNNGLHLIINQSNNKSNFQKQQWHLHCLTGFFLLSIVQAASQKDALPHIFVGVRTVDRVCSLCVCVHANSCSTARWFTLWYDSSHVCIPAASWEAVHVHDNNEVLLKNRPASFIFLSFCLLDDLSGVASTNVCPCCCASCSPLPSSLHVSFLQWSSSLLFSSLADVVKAAVSRLMGSFREVGKSPHWFLNFSRKLRSAWDKKCIVLCVFHSHAWWSRTCRTTSEKLK